MPSVFVYGTVFGGLAVQAGLRPIEVWGMSVLVFAGASQFVAVPMMAAFKIFCERVESLQPVAAFLGDDEPETHEALLQTAGAEASRA